MWCVKPGCVLCHPWLCSESPLVVFCVSPGCVPCQSLLCAVSPLVVCRVTPGCVPCHPWLCAVSPLVVCPVTPGSQCQRIGYNTITGLWDWASLIVHGFNQLLRWTRVTRIRAQAAIPRLIKSSTLQNRKRFIQQCLNCTAQAALCFMWVQMLGFCSYFKSHKDHPATKNLPVLQACTIILQPPTVGLVKLIE